MELLESFKNHLLSQKNASKITVKNYLADVRKFIRWFEITYQRSFTARLVTPELAQEYIKEISTNAPSSVKRYVSSLKKFFTFLKAEGQTGINPFEVTSDAPKENPDPWHLKEFKHYLSFSKASKLTIKNYMIDVHQFLKWLHETIQASEGINNRALIFGKLNTEVVEKYKEWLLDDAKLSPVSVNRKLSSLRKYISWISEKGLLKEEVAIGATAIKQAPQTPVHDIVVNPVAEQPEPLTLETLEEIVKAKEEAEEKKSEYSNIPFIRFGQKVGKGINMLFEWTVIVPFTKTIAAVKYRAWKASGKQVFTPLQEVVKAYGETIPEQIKAAAPMGAVSKTVSASAITLTLIDKLLGVKGKKTIGKIRNIPKAVYAPLEISTKHLPWSKKFIHILRHKRPKWYKKYHSYAFVHYLHLGILLIFVTTTGFGFYQAFIGEPNAKKPALAALPTAPPRILSFQGRLTDASNTPITAESSLRFGIYNDLTATGSALLWQETQTVTPDENGIFSVMLGTNSPISQTLFANNAGLYLGITVGTDTELQPRQQLATVAYASNSETLQGLRPITEANAGTANVVLALDSSGNMTIGGSASPTFQATGGEFTLSGQTLVLATNPGSDTNIELVPDGEGIIDMQKPLQNTSNYNNISSARGAVEVDDLFAILANSNGQSAFTINQNGAGPLISASSSGAAKFTVFNSGAGTFASDLTINGNNLTTTSTTFNIMNTTVTNLNIGGSATSLSLGASSGITTINNSLTVANNTTFGGITYTWPTSGQANGYVLTTNGSGALSWSAINALPTSQWQVNSGAVAPATTTNDLLIGGSATSSAKFVVSGTTGNMANAGTVTFSAFGAGILRTNSSGVVAASAVNLASSDVTGALAIANGGTNATSIGSAGSLAYSTGSAYGFTGVGTAGQCLISNGSGAPIWGSCDSAAAYWQESNGAISPTNSTTDFLLGGSATTSAKFGFVNINSGTPTASISANTGDNATYLSGNGILGTTNAQTLSLGSSTTGNVALNPGGTTALTALTNGNVGIGTTNPEQALHVNGRIYVGTGGGAASDLSIEPQGTFSRMAFQQLRFFDYNLGTDMMTFNNGAVGINTTTPLAALDVQGNSGTIPVASVSGQTSQAALVIDNSGSGDLITASQSGLSRFSVRNGGGISLNAEGLTDQATVNQFDTTITKDSGLAFGTMFRTYAAQTGSSSVSQFSHYNNLEYAASSSTNQSGDLVASLDQVNWRGTGNSTGRLIGSIGKIVSYTGAGTIDNAIASLADGTFDGGTVNNFYGSYIRNPNGSSTVNNVYGLYIENMTKGSTNNFGLYAAGGKNYFGGSVGVGTTNPLATLDVRGMSGTTPASSTSAQTSFAAMVVDNTGTGDIFTASSSGQTRFAINQNGSTQIYLNSQIGSGGQRLCHSGADGSNQGLVTLADCNASSADYAEEYGTQDVSIEAGDVVAIDPTRNAEEIKAHDTNSSKAWIVKTNKSYQSTTIGIVSTSPNDVIGKTFSPEENPRPVALTGRVPVKIASSSAEIKQGDYITSSDMPGRAMKATKSGPVIGKALESWDPASGKSTIIVFVQNDWHTQGVTLSENGTIDTIPGQEPTIAALQTKSLTSDTLSAKSLAAEEITINGKNLQEYILATIAQSVVTSASQTTTLPEPTVTQLAATSVPTSFTHVTVPNETPTETIATKDAQGNAVFAEGIKAKDASLSGTLTAQDASFSGVLRADKIIANQIEGLEMNSTTNITNIYNSMATPSASLPIASESALPLPEFSAQEVNLIKQLITSPLSPFNASSAAELNIDSLDVKKATVSNDLNVLGKTTVNDLGVTGSLTTGVLAINGLDEEGNASINTMGGDLKIQSAGVGGVDILAGKFKIDTKGNINVQGNATFAKDVTIKGKLQAKDIKSSGTGTFVDIATNALKIVRGAQADTSATETSAEGSAGTTVIKANKTERTVVSPYVNKDSLIYITATSDTQGVMPYVARQTAEDKKAGTAGSFTIEIPSSVKKDIKINWWIVN